MKIIYLCGIFFSLMLIGCSQHRNYVPAPVVVKPLNCQDTCANKAKLCSNVCHNSCYNCSIYREKTANCSYSRFIHEEKIKGGINSRDKQSYKDPLQCRKVTCNCLADYQVCMQGCTGTIHKKLAVVPHC